MSSQEVPPSSPVAPINQEKDYQTYCSNQLNHYSNPESCTLMSQNHISSLANPLEKLPYKSILLPFRFWIKSSKSSLVVLSCGLISFESVFIKSCSPILMFRSFSSLEHVFGQFTLPSYSSLPSQQSRKFNRKKNLITD